MDSEKINLGLVQMKMSQDPEANLAHALDLVAQAAAKKADIVCLPELFTTPYFCQYEKSEDARAEPIPGPASQALGEAAKRHNITLVGGSIYEQEAVKGTGARGGAGKKYNTAMVFAPDGSMQGIYRKTHIPHDPGFWEQHYFEPGDTGFRVFDTPKAKVSPLICYDQWFPEAARACALMGADILFYPTAIGTMKGVEQAEGPWQTAWENVMRGHAIANNVIVAGVNRVGVEGDETFWGGSFVCDAFGKTLVRGGAGEEVLVCPVDLEHSRMVREGWRFFPNRRPEAYGKLVEKRR